MPLCCRLCPGSCSSVHRPQWSDVQHLHGDLQCSGGQRRAVSIAEVVAGCPTNRRLDAEQLWHPEGASCGQAGLLSSMPPVPGGVKHPPKPSTAAYFHQTCSCLIMFEIGEFKSHLRERTWVHVPPCAGCMTPPPLARRLAAGVAAPCPAAWTRVPGLSVPGYGLDLEGKFGL